MMALLSLLLLPWAVLAQRRPSRRDGLLGQPDNYQPYHESSSSSTCVNCSDNEESLFEPQQYLIRKDDPFAPFYQFYTAGPGQFSPQSFQFYSSGSFYITLVDCFCSGDAYQLYDNGLLVTPSGGCIPVNPDGFCSAFVTDPVTCLNSPESFCRTSVSFSEGFHNLTIQSVLAPYLTAGGYVFPGVNLNPQ